MHGQLPMDAAAPANRHVVHPDSIMYGTPAQHPPPPAEIIRASPSAVIVRATHGLDTCESELTHEGTSRAYGDRRRNIAPDPPYCYFRLMTTMLISSAGSLKASRSALIALRISAAG